MRIIAPDFVATFETADGVVRRADSAIAYLVGWTDDEVREFVYSKSWHAAIISGGLIRVNTETAYTTPPKLKSQAPPRDRSEFCNTIDRQAEILRPVRALPLVTPKRTSR